MENNVENININSEIELKNNLTPMIKQYQEIKSRHRDKIILFRVGDFYEMFFNDAIEISKVLNIVLTSRNDVPMAGFPFHAANSYIYKLIQAGYKVAICEQLEDPSKAKGIVKRDVVDIITPSTVIDENFLNKNQNNFLASLYGDLNGLAIIFIDIGTGDFFGISSKWFVDVGDRIRILEDSFEKFQPSEIIYNDSISQSKDIIEELKKYGNIYQSYPNWYFDENSQYLPDNYEIEDNIKQDKYLYKSILGAFHYLMENRGIGIENFNSKLTSILKKFTLLNKTSFLEMDDFTIKNLELIKNKQDNTRKYTLLEVLDSTITPMGARLLRNWIVMPLYDVKKIHNRLNTVEIFFEDSIFLNNIRELLKSITDLDRLATRLIIKRVIPGDLISLSISLKNCINLKSLLKQKEGFEEILDLLVELPDVINLIDNSIKENPSSSFNGDVIKEGFNKELDDIRNLLIESKDYIIKLQNRERERTKINSLKIKYNNVFGYFIEVSKANLDNVPSDYIRKQSLVNAERYTIPELNEYEMKISNATEKVQKLEEEIFNSILDEINKYIHQIQKISYGISLLDIYSNFALVAKENNYTKPIVTNEDEIIIKEGRHPVVEKYIGRNLFIPNDTILDGEDNRIWIITGPNMAGKSTFLRQNALIMIMAQIGSYVPAKYAKIGIVDKIFTRIGASDNLSEGQSTFLVEMKEAANIIKNSTKNSLIIMDELGRGTSTYDGLSIAWAVIEYIQEHPEITGKTLFATHYHELTKLGEKKGIKNYNIAVREYKDELVFLRKVIEGPADRSYGIYVAKLAGIPEEIIQRAKLILETLESEGNIAKNKIEKEISKNFRKKIGIKENSDQLELFQTNNYDYIIQEIKNLDLNNLTPIEALNFLAKIKKEIY